MRRRLVMVVAVLLAAAACGGGGGDELSSAEFCQRAEEAGERLEALEDLGSEEDPAAAAEQLDAIEEEISALAEDAPPEIRDDLQTVADGMAELSSAFEDVDPDDPASAMAALGQIDEATITEMEEAAERVETYFSEECGIEPSE